METTKDRDPMVFGRNVRLARSWFGWSMRDLANVAGIGLRTVVRIEQGGGCQLKTEEKIAKACRMSIGLLWDTDLKHSHQQQLILPEDGRWLFGDMEDGKRHLKRKSKVDDAGAPAIASLDPDSIQDQGERLRLGLAGLSRGFIRSLSCNLASERHVAGVSEIYRKDFNSPIPGKYLLYVLEGGLRIEIRNQIFDVPEAGAFFFDSNHPWTAEPWHPDGPAAGPTRLLYVSLTPNKLSKQ